MSEFKVGDMVIVKSTIGNTNEVRKVVDVKFTPIGDLMFETYIVSGGNVFGVHQLQLWNPKTDTNGGYMQALKLKIGATYKRLDGETRKITAMTRCFMFSFLDEFNEAYSEDGRHKTSDQCNLIEEVVVPILKLEVGKRYKRRDGAIVTIRGFSGYDDFDYCTTKGSSYMKNGNYHVDGRYSDFDLVEVIEETNVKSLKLEIGKSYRRRNGEVRVIVGISKDDSCDYVDNKGSDYLANGRFYTEEIISPEYDLVKEVKDEVKMQEISMNKRYKTREGRPIILIAIDKIKNCVIAELNNDIRSSWDLYGHWGAGWSSESHMDLIEVKPYEDFKVDDKVLVSNNRDVWLKAYFCKVSDDGKVIVFDDGETSYTAKFEGKFKWDKCVRWEDRTSDMRVL